MTVGITLIIGGDADPLSRRLIRMLPSTIRHFGPEIFSETTMQFDGNGFISGGRIRVNRRRIDMAQLRAVIFRPTGNWMLQATAPSKSTLFDQHEQRAAWCAFLVALQCPILNRLPPAWFVSAKLYRRQLTLDFATIHGMPLASLSHLSEDERTTRRRTAYLIGTELIPVDDASDDAFRRVGLRRTLLIAWLERGSPGFMRVDLQDSQPPRLDAVDAIPDFNHTAAALLNTIAGRIAAMMS